MDRQVRCESQAGYKTEPRGLWSGKDLGNHVPLCRRPSQVSELAISSDQSSSQVWACPCILSGEQGPASSPFHPSLLRKQVRFEIPGSRLLPPQLEGSAAVNNHKLLISHYVPEEPRHLPSISSSGLSFAMPCVAGENSCPKVQETKVQVPSLPLARNIFHNSLTL